MGCDCMNGAQGKYKLNFKERMENLGFSNYNDLSFWKGQINMRKISKTRETIWVVETNGQRLCSDRSVLVCVQYLEDNHEQIT